MCTEDTLYRERVEQTMSEAFEVSTGLKQGDSLSPTLFNLAMEKAIREMQIETTGITIGQQQDMERAAKVLERAASKIGLKINMDKTKIMELLGEEDNTDTGSLAFEKVNELSYLGAVLSKNNGWAREIRVRIIKAERAAFALNNSPRVGKPTGKIPQGRPRKRWLDLMEDDLYRMGVQDWKELAQDRDKWRDLVMAVKTLIF
ncbi:hypothetical protein AGLY_016203 [Aphis glycines]|uniref:Reverse transcriptase domain-containing protein n=1 Tax=Aphis glycines TaxID=307491 RepID=A0A6G0T151_APHGL|nr:hypothetical protein AGLY_016203 [Aphis glycines]